MLSDDSVATLKKEGVKIDVAASVNAMVVTTGAEYGTETDKE